MHTRSIGPSAIVSVWYSECRIIHLSNASPPTPAAACRWSKICPADRPRSAWLCVGCGRTVRVGSNMDDVATQIPGALRRLFQTFLPIKKQLPQEVAGVYESFPPDEVQQLLERLGLLELLPKFREEQIDMVALQLMTNEDFETMGVKIGPRVKICDALRRLRPNEASAPLAPGGGGPGSCTPPPTAGTALPGAAQGQSGPAGVFTQEVVSDGLGVSRRKPANKSSWATVVSPVPAHMWAGGTQSRCSADDPN